MNVEDRCGWISAHSARHTLTLRVGTHEHSFVDLSGVEWGSADEEHAALHRSMANAMNSIDKVSGIEQWIESEADRDALCGEESRQRGQAYKRRIQRQGK